MLGDFGFFESPASPIFFHLLSAFFGAIDFRMGSLWGLLTPFLTLARPFEKVKLGKLLLVVIGILLVPEICCLSTRKPQKTCFYKQK